MFFGGAGRPVAGAAAAGRRRPLGQPAAAEQPQRSTDGWDDEELGKVYNHRVVVRLSKLRRAVPLRASLMALFGTPRLRTHHALHAVRRRAASSTRRSTRTRAR